jgi:hypothetical protein
LRALQQYPRRNPFFHVATGKLRTSIIAQSFRRHCLTSLILFLVLIVYWQRPTKDMHLPALMPWTQLAQPTFASPYSHTDMFRNTDRAGSELPLILPAKSSERGAQRLEWNFIGRCGIGVGSQPTRSWTIRSSTDQVIRPGRQSIARDKTILREREKIKKQTIRQRRLQHQKQAA